MHLSPSSKPCITCGMQISWDQHAREQLNWRGPLNLDGSQHRHNQNTVITPRQREEGEAGMQTEKVVSSVSPSSSSSSPSPSPSPSPNQLAIQQAHEENMKSGEELRQSLDGLTIRIYALNDTLISIDKTMVVLTETIKAYLDLPK